jgi:hypothetical protein
MSLQSDLRKFENPNNLGDQSATVESIREAQRALMAAVEVHSSVHFNKLFLLCLPACLPSLSSLSVLTMRRISTAPHARAIRRR